MLCRQRQQVMARRRGHEADRFTGVFDGVAAGGDPLVGRDAGLGGDHLDARHIQVELLGPDQAQSRGYALSDVNLAGAEDDAPVRYDGQPVVQHRMFCEARIRRHRYSPDLRACGWL
jgi:hypothetical protein